MKELRNYRDMMNGSYAEVLLQRAEDIQKDLEQNAAVVDEFIEEHYEICLRNKPRCPDKETLKPVLRFLYLVSHDARLSTMTYHMMATKILGISEDIPTSLYVTSYAPLTFLYNSYYHWNFEDWHRGSGQEQLGILKCIEYWMQKKIAEAKESS